MAESKCLNFEACNNFAKHYDIYIKEKKENLCDQCLIVIFFFYIYLNYFV